MKFNGSLLREKFSIQNTASGDDGGKDIDISAASARMPVILQSGTLPPERLIIRTHNMHSCVRLAGKILHNYDKNGPILSRSPALHWRELWEDCLPPYERIYMKHHWAAVYHKGKTLFSDGAHHPFLDVIEKCDALEKGDYDNSIKMAREALKMTGSTATIMYDSGVALVAHLDRSSARCGIAIRNSSKTNNFNLALHETATSGKINISLGLSISAAFLEGVQLAFFIGQQKAKLKKGIIQRFSRDDKNTREARERLAQLDAEISAAENRFTVRYRPERPSFLEIIEISDRAGCKNFLDLEQV